MYKSIAEDNIDIKKQERIWKQATLTSSKSKFGFFSVIIGKNEIKFAPRPNP